MNRPLPSRLRPRSILSLGAVALGAALACAPALAAPDGGASTARATLDTGYALVQLTADPLSTYARTQPAKGKKIDFSSSTVKSYRALLSKARNDYKAWLRTNAPQASVTGEFDIALNAVSVKLNGATLEQVSATSMVRSAQYAGLYFPAATDPDLALINAEQAWAQAGGAPGAGAGVKVAIVDSGVDATHPCFADTGYPAHTQFGDRRYTNNKVIAARVFNNKVNQNGFDAKAVGEHGTHVAGTVACNHQTPASVNGVAIPYAMSGVAPRALLGNYNVFPGTVDNARSEDILNALESAYADGMDVANMSLGGGSQGIQDLLTVAVDNLDRANMVVTISNGNEGPGYFTVGSPGMAARGLTAGASTVPHFIGAPVSVAGSVFGAASGDFAIVSSDLTAPLAVVAGTVNGLNNACAALPAGSLTGTVALVSRGACTFSTKIRNAQAAGAVAVLVANNVAGDPTAMAADGTANQPTVPAYMVGLADGQTLRGLGGAGATIGSSLAYVLSTNANIMAGFSSQGPTDVDFRVKPDVVAPGVNVLSSIPTYLCGGAPCFALLSGTSMAAPHLAGSAAVLRQQHPDWSAAEVRSAIVNTASRGVLKDFARANPVSDVNIVGAGLENLLAATGATVSLDPVSLSFGAVPSGSGQSRTLSLTITNLSGVAKSLTLAIGAQPAGVTYSVSPSAIALDAGASTTVSVTMQAAVGAGGHQQAQLELSEGGSPVGHAVLFTLMK
ncbi:S8 family serine peptidase [uncultured Piscinibacter sp.]|uniref:S8 family serine peptidase n=1 Tax=uncultured Piscinibacter sp. TaxID=1131835 RepID=UPI002627E262|nr:S8 family serine peptidase [uncultured Piscinibacter sp.]